MTCDFTCHLSLGPVVLPHQSCTPFIPPPLQTNPPMAALLGDPGEEIMEVTEFEAPSASTWSRDETPRDWDDWAALGEEEEPSLDMLNRVLSEVAPQKQHARDEVKLLQVRQANLLNHLPFVAFNGHRSDPLSPSVCNSSWKTSRPSSAHSSQLRTARLASNTQSLCPNALHLPDDVSRYIISYLWPVHELFNLRLACWDLKVLIDSLRIDCGGCGMLVGWQEVVGCGSCFVSSCRECAGLQSMPDASLINTYSAKRCGSCGGRLERQWQCCPWCSTLRGNDARKILRYIRRPSVLGKPNSWESHPCGHSMQIRRSCELCTQSCSQCGELACKKCIWRDGSRKACYSCMVTCG